MAASITHVLVFSAMAYAGGQTYIVGEAADDCPPGSSKMSLEECQNAGVSGHNLIEYFATELSAGNMPSGCFQQQNTVFLLFNSHPVGRSTMRS